MINDQEATVVDEKNAKLKADFDKDTKIFRLFYPGAIQFSDSDYDESKGSRLATDTRMSKVPDNVLYENSVSQIQMQEVYCAILILLLPQEWNHRFLRPISETNSRTDGGRLQFFNVDRGLYRCLQLPIACTLLQRLIRHETTN